MIFQWDETKEAINKRKHGISFSVASLVFADPLSVTRRDHNEEEDRWQIIGYAGGILMLLVVYTMREEEKEQAIRIISARRATTRERREYEKGKWFS